MRLFGEKGFVAVSTRDLALAAQTTLPSISHHFGSKEGLYRAVMQEIAEQLEQQLSPASARALQLLARQRATRALYLGELQHFLAAQARAVLQAPAEWTALFAQQETLSKPEFAIIDEVLTEHVTQPCLRLVAAINKQHPGDADVKLQTVSLIGRILIYRTRRAALLSLMDWPDLTAERIELILNSLSREVDLAFCHDRRSRPSRRKVCLLS